MATDKEIKTAIAERWVAAGTATGEPVRVIKRWKLSLKGKELLSALRSVTDDGKINGVYITRTKRGSRKIGHNHWEYSWLYTMYYFRTYEEGGGVNSEDRLNALLEAAAEEFENYPDLGLEIDDHGEMQVENIDTLDLSVHAALCTLTVNQTKQG